VEAVIDNDLASAALAADLRADALLVLTDVDAVYADWGTPHQTAIRYATPANLLGGHFADGSMGPKVRAACDFVTRTGRPAAIGSVDDAAALLTGDAGTRVTPDEVQPAGVGAGGRDQAV
jgi:carbamate kinase